MDPTRIPLDVWSMILAYMASSSADDFISFILTCKHLYLASRDQRIYQNMSLRDLSPYERWLTDGKLAFLEKCAGDGNPEAIFLKGVRTILNSTTFADALPDLRRATDLGYGPARYTLGIFLILLGDETKQEGVQYIGGCDPTKILEYRERLRLLLFNLLGGWISPQFPARFPRCCDTHVGVVPRSWWLADQIELTCVACISQRELLHASRSFPIVDYYDL